MYRSRFAGRYASRFFGLNRLQIFNGWWPLVSFQLRKNVIGFYLASPRVRHNASEGEALYQVWVQIETLSPPQLSTMHTLAAPLLTGVALRRHRPPDTYFSGANYLDSE